MLDIPPVPRLLVEATLRPLQGTRFQPTGFPDVGAGHYKLHDGTEMLLVESAQSVANRLEAVCWDEVGYRLLPFLEGLPYVEVTDGTRTLTTSLLEAHRLNSAYIMNSDRASEIEQAIGFDDKRPLDKRALIRALARYDLGCLLHGVFLEKIAGVLRLPRALSGFVEARNVSVVAVGGVKNDRVRPGKDAEAGATAREGYGNVPFHRDEYTAEAITAYFNLDLDQIRSYGLGKPGEQLLFGLACWKIGAFLERGLRLRTACDLDLVEVRVRRPPDFTLPTPRSLEELLPSLIREAQQAGMFPVDAVTRTTYKTAGEEEVIALSVRFLAGRYHATAWDHQVNEGAVEWPPSPWRLLRALLAGSYRALSPPEPERVRHVLEKLAAELPIFSHVPASTGHVRHWMPTSNDKTKVFDAFVAVGRGAVEPSELLVAWPEAELSSGDREILRSLCRAVPYLGRAESWAELEVAEGAPRTIGARPARPGDERTVAVLAPMPPSEYEAWHAAFVPTGTGRKRIVPPATLWEALHADTGTLQRQGWSQAPGSRWTTYAFEREPFAVLRRTRPVIPRARPDLAWFAVHSEPPVRLEKSVAVGDALRRALLARSDAHPVFVGRDPRGQHLEGHGHAHFLPTDADHDGFIDHLLVWAPSGFDAGAMAALASLEAVYGVGAFPLGVTLLNLGARAELGPLLELGEGRVWESRTPFVPPRHSKWRKGKDLPAEQVARLAELVLGAAPVSVEPIDEVHGRPAAWHRFYRQRLRGGGSRGSERGYGFRLAFEQPIHGPLALGYGAHMGLGRFVCVSP